MGCVRDNLIYAGIALGALVIVVLVSFLASPPQAAKGHGALRSAAASLVRASAEAVEASQQDADPTLAVVHAQQGLNYLEAARRLVDDAALERLMDAPLADFTALARAQSQRALQALGASPARSLAGAYASLLD